MEDQVGYAQNCKCYPIDAYDNEMVPLHSAKSMLVGCVHWMEAIMEDVMLIGIDLGKHSFYVHGQDRHGKALLSKKFNRKQLVEFFAKFHADRL